MELINFFDKNAKYRDKWIKKNYYYNKELIKFLKFHIPEKSNILEIGSGTGFLLNVLNPKVGVGIDFSEEMNKIAREKYPNLRFINANAVNYKLNEKFDYIIIVDTIGYFEDVQEVFKNIRQNCTNKTRVIITSYSHLWEPLLKSFEFFGLKMKQPFTNWLSIHDIENLLKLENFDVIQIGKKILIPKYIPIISHFSNKYITNFPFFKNFGLVQYIISRPINIKKREEKSISIIVASRNEEGNIEKVVESLPKLGKKLEIIFVEGDSKDNTWEEIKRVSEKYKNIKYIKQEGKGKGDAVRNGFNIANGEILMIYDADMTVPPKDLIKFYEAITSNKGEFINGCRLVYPMKKEAMRTLNLFGNKMFSLVFSWLLNQRIKDTLCGTKVISKENYEILKKNRPYFGDFDPFGDFDLLFGASKMDLKIVEVPIRYKERTYGDSNIRRFAHGWLLIKMCLFAMKKIKFV